MITCLSLKHFQICNVCLFRKTAPFPPCLFLQNRKKSDKRALFRSSKLFKQSTDEELILIKLKRLKRRRKTKPRHLRKTDHRIPLQWNVRSWMHLNWSLFYMRLREMICPRKGRPWWVLYCFILNLSLIVTRGKTTICECSWTTRSPTWLTS